MSGEIEFRLNGRAVRVDSVSPNLTLLEWLRGTGLTGSKEGCAEGDCGACSVAIVDRDARGKRCYRAINSCLVPLPLMAGREIISVEGVACCSHDPKRCSDGAAAAGSPSLNEPHAEGCRDGAQSPSSLDTRTDRAARLHQ